MVFVGLTDDHSQYPLTMSKIAEMKTPQEIVNVLEKIERHLSNIAEHLIR
jgi:hypothetical protein